MKATHASVRLDAEIFARVDAQIPHAAAVNAWLAISENDTRPNRASGDTAALLRHWFTAHLRAVQRALAKYGVSGREDRADLIQNVFVTAYLAILRGDEIDNPRAWLRECARKHASNHRHKEARRARPTGEIATLHGQDPERIAADRERLRRAFGSLDEEARGLVFDVHTGETSWSEVARKRGISVNQARYLYQRSLAQMEAVLEHDDESFAGRRASGRQSGRDPVARA